MNLPIKRIAKLITALLLAFFPLYVAAQSSNFPEVRLYLDADRAFVTKTGSEAAATQFIHELVARVDAIYRSQVGITVTVAGIHLWNSDDPFDRTTDSTLLSSFTSYAEANYRGSVTYDAAHLLVGNGLGGEGGIAYPQSACGDIFSAPYAYSTSQPDITDEYEFNAHLLAHELGHNLSAEHDAFPACRVKNIMCPGQIGGAFSSASIAAINSYVTSRQSAGCFSLVPKSDPLTTVHVAASTKGSSIKYKVTGASACTTLTLVASPSQVGLRTLFGYLQLGVLHPGDLISANSKNAPTLRAKKSKIYIGAYCDGQLAASKAVVDGKKIKSRFYTPSAVLFLRSLKRTFR